MNSYYEAEGLNYSTLAQLDSNNPGLVFREGNERKSFPAMEKGSLVDCLITSPEEFNDRFIISEVTELSDSLKGIIDQLIILDKPYTAEALLEVAKEVGVGGKSNWSDETILKRVKTTETEKYFNEKKLTTDKTKITQAIYDQARNVVEVLKTHGYSSWIFNPEPGCEVMYQVAVYWEEKGIPCKALLDIIFIDHNKKLIYPIDLKIKSESKYSFIKSFIRYKYYLQAVWYGRAVFKKFETQYPNYKIQTFRFLVTSFEYPDPPLIYVCSNNVVDIGLSGGVIGNKKVKGIRQLFDDYLWYNRERKFNYPREVYENKGILELDFYNNYDE